jgi:hypothetical protein
MAEFDIGDKVQMPGTLFTVEVLEIGVCEDYGTFGCHPETFRFADPHTGEDDWMHTDEFEKVA